MLRFWTWALPSAVATLSGDHPSGHWDDRQGQSCGLEALRDEEKAPLITAKGLRTHILLLLPPGEGPKPCLGQGADGSVLHGRALAGSQHKALSCTGSNLSFFFLFAVSRDRTK